jgi:hypothetical protein
VVNSNLKNLSIIVCNNGLGHLTRVLYIVNNIIKKIDKLKINIFVDSFKLDSFNVLLINIKNRIELYDIKAGVINYEEEFFSKYYDKIIQADYIVSDNLLFILKYRSDSLITGSFLWLDEINDNNFKDKEKELLIKFRPVMIGSEYFATKTVKEMTNFIGVGIYNYYNIDLSKKPLNILISFGKNNNNEKYFENEIINNVNGINELSENVKIFIDNKYYKYFENNDNIYSADFTEDMYSRLSAAIIRPGLGTVCSALSKGTRLFAFSEKGNNEMDNNKKVIKHLDIGEECINLEDAINKLKKYCFNDNLIKKNLNNIKKLKFNGVDETADYIIKVIKNER